MKRFEGRLTIESQGDLEGGERSGEKEDETEGKSSYLYYKSYQQPRRSRGVTVKGTPVPLLAGSFQTDKSTPAMPSLFIF
jgi:hypothetical protein